MQYFVYRSCVKNEGRDIFQKIIETSQILTGPRQYNLEPSLVGNHLPVTLKPVTPTVHFVGFPPCLFHGWDPQSPLNDQ